MTALRVVEEPKDRDGHVDYWSAAAGDMWPCPYVSHNIPGRSPCWIVRLPERAWVWHTNVAATGGGFWMVTGEPPQITVSPSINIGPEIWHGHIKGGEMNP